MFNYYLKSKMNKNYSKKLFGLNDLEINDYDGHLLIAQTLKIPFLKELMFQECINILVPFRKVLEIYFYALPKI